MKWSSAIALTTLLSACSSTQATTEPATDSASKAVAAKPDKGHVFGCKDIEPQPDLDTSTLTEEALSTTVPFTFGHAKENVRAAYAQYFEDISVPARQEPPAKTKTDHGYVVENFATTPGNIPVCQRPRESIRIKAIGVWYFFDHTDRIKTIRLDRPFDGTYRGVKLGVSRSELVDRFGEPYRIFEWGGDHAHVFKMPDGNDLRVDIEPAEQIAIRVFD